MRYYDISDCACAFSTTRVVVLDLNTDGASDGLLHQFSDYANCKFGLRSGPL